MVRKKEYPDYLGSSNMAKDRRSLNDFFYVFLIKKITPQNLSIHNLIQFQKSSILLNLSGQRKFPSIFIERQWSIMPYIEVARLLRGTVLFFGPFGTGLA